MALPLLTLLGKLSINQMGIAERRERQKKEVRDSILQAAWQMVQEEGWQSVSIRKIADAIEYSVPVVYDHFENKEAILFEFNKQGFKLLTDALRVARSQHEQPTAQLEAIAHAYWNFAFENKALYQLMYGLGMPGCESAKNMPELIAFVEILHSTIEAIIKEGKNTEADSMMKKQSFWSMLHGLVSINLMAQATSYHDGMNQEDLNKMVLKDFICNFIKGLTT